MFGSVYLKSLRDLRGMILAWGLGLAAVGAVNVAFFPAFQSMPEITTFLKNLPPVFKSFMGNVQAMLTLEGFLKIKIFDVLPLLLGIFGITQGARALTGELEHKTCDLLLAQPLPRRRVVIDKFLAIVTASLLIGILAAAGLLISCAVAGDEVNRAYLLLGVGNGLPLAWVFSAISLLGSAALAGSRRAVVLGAFAMATCYVFETLRLVSPSLAGWRTVSPFAHHRDALSFSGHLALGQVFVFLGMTIIFVGLAVWVFSKRDLR